jgi:hypothetical protein
MSRSESGSTRRSAPEPSLAALRGRIGAYALHAKHGNDTARVARDAFRARFERLVDPDRTLDPEERARRASAALREHMARLSYKSAAGRRRAGTRNGEEAG